MEIFVKAILPVIILIAIFLLMRSSKIKGLFTAGAFIKARIIIGCTGAGLLLGMAILSQNPKEIIGISLFALIVLYGAFTLQNKYLYIKR